MNEISTVLFGFRRLAKLGFEMKTSAAKQILYKKRMSFMAGNCERLADSKILWPKFVKHYWTVSGRFRSEKSNYWDISNQFDETLTALESTMQILQNRMAK